jgi:hypothetical protein
MTQGTMSQPPLFKSGTGIHLSELHTIRPDAIILILLHVVSFRGATLFSAVMVHKGPFSRSLMGPTSRSSETSRACGHTQQHTLIAGTNTLTAQGAADLRTAIFTLSLAAKKRDRGGWHHTTLSARRSSYFPSSPRLGLTPLIAHIAGAAPMVREILPREKATIPPHWMTP